MASNFKTKITYHTANSLIDYINRRCFAVTDILADELLACLNCVEIYFKLAKMTLEHKEKYTIKLTPAQGISLMLLFANEPKTGSHFLNEMMIITNAIHRQYFPLIKQQKQLQCQTEEQRQLLLQQ
jgi:hypothetical protein